MNRPKSKIPPILPFYLGSMIILLVLRILFYVYHHALFHSAGSGEVSTAFVNGLMIDSSVTATTLVAIFVPTVLIWFFSRHVAFSVFRTLAVVSMSVFFFINLSDIVYYDVFNSRLNVLFLDSLGQMTPILKTIVHDYPIFKLLVVWAVVVVLFLLLVRLLQKYLRFSLTERYAKTSAAVSAILMVFLTFLWTGEPFWRMNRFSLQDQSLNQLSLNGVYTVVKAWDQKRILERDAAGVEYDYQPIADAIEQLQKVIISGSEQRVSDVSPFDRIIRHPRQLKVAKPNVVIILMEGFSASYIGALNPDGSGYSPGFDSLSREGLFFTNFYGQGTRTHYGLVSTVGSFPSILNMFLTRRRGTESFYTLGNIFRDYGYNTSFIYGYDQGFDHMGFFMKQGGIEKVIDRKDFVDPVKFEAEWGVSDEDLYDKADGYFTALGSDQPFFSVLMTSSNHSPFEVPPYFKELHPEYTDKHKTSFAYSDYCLSQFLHKARDREYFDKTIFVIVADHGEILDQQDREFKRFQIPCLIYAPSLVTEPRTINTVGSQVDIGTTLMHLIGYPGVFMCMGRNLLSLPEEDGWAVMRSDNTAYMRKDHRVLVRDMRDTATALYELDDNFRMLTDRPVSSDSLKAAWNHQLETYLQVAYYLYSTGKYRYSHAMPTAADRRLP